jgi:hypothetical protein
MTCDHIGDIGHVGPDGQAGIVVNPFMGELPFTASQATHGGWIHGANPIQVEAGKGTGKAGAVPMDGISLQCSELLFRDGFTDDKATEVIVFHLVATGGTCGAGLGKIPFGALEAFGSGELEELIYD